MATITISPDYGYVLAVAVLTTIELMVLGGMVGRARKRYNVAYPRTDGADIPKEFLNYNRAHYNMIEGLPFFFIVLFIGGLYQAKLAALLGVVYIVGRAVYAIGYYSKPESRGIGALIFHLAELPLLIMSGMFIYGLVTLQ